MNPFPIAVFSYPAFLWFLPLLGVVVLIHLINMFRHRRVEWAALEFLLASYKKSRTRILLQQLLLMLLRTLAVALVILMLAQPKFEGRWADLFMGKSTHHIILLDDSYSVSDRNAAQGGTPLFDDLIGVMNRIVDGAEKKNSGDRLTLIRLSRVADIETGSEPDIAERLLNADEIPLIREIFQNLESSPGADDPERLLVAAENICRQTKTNHKPVVYFLSDFRRRNWENPTPILKSVEEIRKLGGMVRMVRATDEERTNLGIAELKLVDGIHAADVDVLIDATVVNHGLDDVENVHLTVRIDGLSQPSLTIPRIKAGEQTVPPVRFPVRLDGAGQHRVEVELQPDSIADDNRRFLVVDVPAALEVLIVSPDRRSASDASQYVRVALSPGGTKSGIRTRLEAPAFLASNPLDSFSAVFLLDVPSLESTAILALESYVARGGGLAIFTGPESSPEFLRTELHKNGEGLFPSVPIGPGSLEPDYLSRTPDIGLTPVKHPVFRLFGEGSGSLLGNVKVEHYIAVEGDATSPGVLATLRNGAPLIVEKTFGKGRVVAFMTSASPVWNNWARGNPSYVVVLLELAAWLSSRSRPADSLRIGDPMVLDLDSSIYEPKVKILLSPKEGETEGSVFQAEGIAKEDGLARISFTQTTKPGFYEAALKEHSGNETKKLFAVNVDPREGEIRLIDVSDLGILLRSVNTSLESAAGFSAPFDFTGDRPWSDMLLYVVLILLVAEMFLAGRILPPPAKT